MEKAFEVLIGQGVLGAFLILVIWYFTKEITSLKEEMKAKSMAHAEQVKEKDEKIEDLNQKIHEMGINAVTAVKEFNSLIRDVLK